MKHLTNDTYLVSDPALKSLISQPPLNVDGFMEQQKEKSIKGTIVISVEELRKVFVAGMEYVKEQSSSLGVDFNTYMKFQGIEI